MSERSGRRRRHIGSRGALAGMLAALALCACNRGMSGAYEGAEGVGRLEFQPNGTVYVTVYGGTFAGEYELDGDRVIVKGPSGSQVFRRRGDRLEGGFGMDFVKD